MDFRILGPLRMITDDGRQVPVTGHRQCTILAMLLLHAYRPVTLAQLVDAVWDGEPPMTARRQIQNAVSELRGRIRRAGVARPVIVAEGSGYRLAPEAGEVDARAFANRVAAGQRHADRDRLAEAVAELRAGLALWSGPALPGLSGRSVDAAVARLSEQRLAAIEVCMDAELRLGQHHQLVGELAGLTTEHPLRERLVGQLMLALDGSGRRAEALEAYQRHRARLADELGLDPGASLLEIHAGIVRGDGPTAPAAVGNAPAARQRPAGPAPVPVPAQLPAAVAGFAGRVDQLKRLDGLLPGGTAGATTVVISAIAGLAGVGKTALAIHWGQRVRDQFPDGQLYVNLRGYATTAPMPPIEALARFLPALGAPPDQLPDEVEAGAALYRSMLAGRRVLVLLDNAASSEQVRPLLPGSPGCLALITSRDRLAGLVARDGARPLRLDVLTADEAHQLLAAALGADRVAADPEGTVELARACSYLPLALRVAAAALIDQPEASIAAYAAMLHRGDRLAGLAVPGEPQAGVRHAFDLSYQALPAGERRLFRLIGLVPTADVTAASAAALAGVPVEDASRMLDRLAAAHLVNRSAPGRYALHDLIRQYAADRAGREDPGAERDVAVRRLIDWYLYCADAAANRLYPWRLRLEVPPPAAPVVAPFEAVAAPGTNPDAAARAWLDAERANLVATIRHTAAQGIWPATWLLADTVRGYFWVCMHTLDWAETARLALAAAEAAGDLRAQAAALLSIGDTDDRRYDRDRAIISYTRALALSEATGWEAGQTAALGNLGAGHAGAGRLPEAVDYYRRALMLSRSAADSHRASYREAVLLWNLGTAYRQLGQLTDAADLQIRALAGFREHGARQGEAAALDELGAIRHAERRYAEAEAELTRALALERTVGDRGTEAYTLRSLAAVHRDTGRGERATELAQAAVALAEDLADHRIEADALNTLGSVRLRLGRAAAAFAAHQRALDVSRTTGYRYTETEALIGLAGAEEQLGLTERAYRHGSLAVRHSREAGFALLEAEAQAIVARIDDRVGHRSAVR
jgi:DNA-binding SARP family transcriptional activator